MNTVRRDFLPNADPPPPEARAFGDVYPTAAEEPATERAVRELEARRAVPRGLPTRPFVSSPTLNPTPHSVSLHQLLSPKVSNILFEQHWLFCSDFSLLLSQAHITRMLATSFGCDVDWYKLSLTAADVRLLMLLVRFGRFS